MPISDLTGTTWVLKNRLGDFSTLSCNINFTSNSNTYSSLSGSMRGARYIDLYYGSTVVGTYSDPNDSYSWNDQSYRIISITGGSDATNSTLISWFQANAVQVPVADLTGTNWILNSNIYITEAVSYSINSIFSDYTFSSIDFNFYTADGKTWKSLKLDNSFAIVEATATANPVENTYSSSILSITGGTDATNPDLITWLSQNATLQVEPIADNKIFLGNLPIKKILIGNIGVSKIIVDNIEVYTKDAVNI